MDGRVKVNKPPQINCFYKFCPPLNVFHTSDQKPSKSELTAAQLAQFDKRRSAGAEGRCFKPRPDQHSGSYNKYRISAAFVKTSAFG